MDTPAQPVLRFLAFSLDPANARLWRDDTAIPLRPKALAVLRFLAERPGKLVTKDELIATVWSGTAVTEWVLTSAIRELREALGDDARRPTFIETVHRRGYRFVAPTAQIASPEASPEDGGALVGRAADLAELETCLQRARNGERQTVFVVGEAGIGKTTLVNEFLRMQPDPGTRLRIAIGQCVEQHGIGEPYLPIIEALGRLCGGADGIGFVDMMRRHAPAWLIQIPGAVDPHECEALERRHGTPPQGRMLREMAALVSALDTPLVLVLEDLHWSDNATLDCAAMLAQRADPAKLLLIGTYRPVEVTVKNHRLRSLHHDLRARRLCHEIWPRPLTVDEIESYLEDRMPEVTTGSELARILFEHSDGNPLFLANIVAYLTASSAVQEDHGRWRLVRDPSALAVEIPNELREMVAAQIDRLPPKQREILEVASLAGRQFPAALVAAGVAADVVDVEALLSALAHSGWMIGAGETCEWPDGTASATFRFHHFLYRSVLRQRVPPARSRQVHERIAIRLAEAYRDRSTDVSAEIAYHYEASGRAELAVPYLEQAAARAIRVGAHDEAIALLERGLATLDGLPATRERKVSAIRLCLALGTSHAPARGNGAPEVERFYLRARDLSRECEEPVHLFRSVFALATTYLARARLRDARATAQQLDDVVATLPLPPLMFAASMVSGMITYHSGDLGEARRLLERADSLRDASMPPTAMDMPTLVSSYLALNLVHLGFPDQGRAQLRYAVEQAEARRPFDRGSVVQVRCFVHIILRDDDGLARVVEEAHALDDFPAAAAIAKFSIGRVLASRGEFEPGLVAMRSAIAAYREARQCVALPVLLAGLAEAESAAGATASALDLLAEARELAESTGEIRYLAELHRLEAVQHAALGNRRAALDGLAQAIAVARAQGARWWELRATTSLAQVALDAAGRPGRWQVQREQLATLVASFTEGSDTQDLREARALLANS